jgi:Flp pilus assembly protein TadD
MTDQPQRPLVLVTPRAARTVAALTASLMAGACSGSLGEHAQSDLLSSAPPAADQAAASPAAGPQTELEKATAYWGKEYGKNPRSLDAALAYAKNLKAMGQKSQALAVLQQAHAVHGNDRKVTSEYGRLALELDQLTVAAPLLDAADDPTQPDWRVISARGTVLAKQGKYKDAIPFYERALTLAQDQPSITNNLAMAYAMSGEAGRAEELLRRAVAADPRNAKVNQNLAIVLGLQGKHDEAKSHATATANAEAASHNSEIMRKLVRHDIRPAAAPAATVQTAKATATRPAVQQAKATAPDLKPAATEQNTAQPPMQPNAAALLADAHEPPVFKPSTR